MKHRVLWKQFFLYHSKSVIKVLVVLNKYKHICVICRQTGSLATDNVPSRTVYQGWGQVQLPKYSSTPSTPNIYQVQVQVQVLILKFVLKSGWT